MLGRILPLNIDNTYRGPKLTVWLLIPIIVIKAVIGLTSMFGGLSVLQGAHNVSAGAFPPEAAQLLVLILARSGLATLVITLLCVVVMIRYRALIPATYVLLLLQHTGNSILLLRESVIMGVSRATVVGLVLLFLTVVGLFASLLGGAEDAERRTLFPVRKTGA